MNLDALFFAAHPDDAELSSGGTIIKLVKSGKKTGVIDLTEGELGTLGSVKTRYAESKKASKILGLSARENLKIPDGNIENTPKNRLKVIIAIRKYRPQIIFFPHWHDRHPDHYHTHKLVKEAAFYSGLEKISTPGLKPHRPKRSYYYMQTYTFEPNVIMDISDTYEDKMKAVSCYSTQFYSKGSTTGQNEPETFISSSRFMEYIEARCRFYGFQVGAEFGEAFCTEEKLKINSHNLFDI